MAKKDKRDYSVYNMISKAAIVLMGLCIIMVGISCVAALEYKNSNPDCKWSFADNCVFIFAGMGFMFALISVDPDLLSINGLIKIIIGVFVIAMIVGIILAIKGVILALAVQYGCLG